MVSKYADHLPLYRQAQIYARQGVALARSTLADWVGRAAFELRPVQDALMADLKRSDHLFMDETRAPVLDPGARLAARQERSAPVMGAFETWLADRRARAGSKSPLGQALAYIAKHLEGLKLFLDNSRVELDSNAVEREIRPIALNRKNALFAGHDAGAENWALIASLIGTCKLNGVAPHAWLADTLSAIVAGRPQSRVAELLPWNYVGKV